MPIQVSLTYTHGKGETEKYMQSHRPVKNQINNDSIEVSVTMKIQMNKNTTVRMFVGQTADG